MVAGNENNRIDTSFIKPFMYEQNELPDIVEDISVDANTSITYVGFALNKTKTTDQATFKIKRITVVTAGNKTTTVTEWAQGSIKYDKVWDNRDIYNYSFKI